MNAEPAEPVPVSSSSDDSNELHAAVSFRTDTLAESVVILLSLTVVQRLVGLCRAVLFCRWLPDEELGQWDMAFSFMMLAAPLSVLALPSSFGRYLEHYRQRGQLRTLLGRTAAWVVFAAVLASAVICLARASFSQLVFGTPERTRLVVLMALTLLAVVLAHYFLDLLNALRNVRLLAVVQFFNSVTFAVIGACLLLAWQQTAQSVVIAYGTTCVLSTVGVAWWLRPTLRALPPATDPIPHRDFWGKLLPYVGWIWLTSLLGNLFAIADRYMIIHYSPVDAAKALSQVGQYYSSRMIPLLLASIALMLGGMITPHLSHDWEQGRRDRVRMRLKLFLKLLGFALAAAAVAVLFAAPLLFQIAFEEGKFDQGLLVLPYTLTYCIWFGITIVSQNYLLCAEKVRLGSLALLAGLVTNVVLNLILLPRLGLLGAVLATTAANALALVLISAFNAMLGFRIDLGVILVLVAPILLWWSLWAALVALAVVAAAAVFSNRILLPDEKQQLAETWNHYAGRLRRFRGASSGRCQPPDEKDPPQDTPPGD